MNRLFFALLVACVSYAGFMMYNQQDLGFLHLSFAEYELKTNLLVAGAVMLAVLACTLFVLYIFSLIQKVFVYFGTQRNERLTVKARNALSTGLIELAEGRFDKAEKLLLKQVDHSENALLAYLAAARAAQQQGAHERRDEYLRKAHTDTPTAEIAIGLTKAELQLAHSQYEQALATLTHLYELSPKHAYVLHLLGKTYQQLSDWEKQRSLLVDIKKLNLLPEDKLLDLETQTWKGLLVEHQSDDSVESLFALWEEVPHHLKILPEMTEHYAQLLIKYGADDQAEALLRNFLNQQWEESIIVLYSELDIQADNTSLESAEIWLQDHQYNAHLLLALGKMCHSNKLWGKARSYLEASLSVTPMPVTYLLLANLLKEHMNETELAQENYRLGLQSLVSINAEKFPDDDSLDTEVSKPDLKLVNADNS